MKIFKKLVVGAMGTVLVGGLLYGNNLLPYSQTAYQRMVDSAHQAVPISFQIDAAKKQLEQIGPEINSMYHQIAKEKVQIKRLEQQLAQQTTELENSEREMLSLRQHVKSGKQLFVASNAKAYTTDRVKEDLRHRFKLHLAAEQRAETAAKTLEVRRTSLETAFEGLEKAQAQQRELAVEIETLTARNRMNNLVKTTHHYDFDDSQLARTRTMVEDIGARIDTEEELLNIAPVAFGQIPVTESKVGDSENILGEIDAWLDAKQTDDQKTETTAEKKLNLNPDLVLAN